MAGLDEEYFSSRRSLGSKDLYWVVPIRESRIDGDSDAPVLSGQFPENWKSWNVLAQFERAPSMEGFISALRMFEGSSNIQYWRARRGIVFLGP